MPQAPQGVSIGAVWVPKRGQKHRPPVTIKQIHRADRSVMTDGGLLRWTDLRKYWKPDRATSDPKGETHASH